MQKAGESLASLGRIGKYELLKKVAAGGMAEIYLARQTGLHQFEKIVAIKKILPHLATQPQFVQMFLDEARLVARFNHPNIVQVYELGQEDDELFIAMEYVHGENLGSIIRRCSLIGRTLPIEHVVKICSEVLAGLHYAHSQSNLDGKPLVVHRDVSPHNILLSFDGSVKLVDFGVAKARSQITTTMPGKIKGKYAYMSPEQCLGNQLDGRSDIFSVGIVMYELVTWTRLFRRASELETLKAVLSDKIKSPRKLRPDLDRTLETIVLKALQRDTNKRFQTAQEMQLQLEDYLVARGLKTNLVLMSQYLQDLFGEKLASRKKVLSKMHAKSLEGAVAAIQNHDSQLDAFLDQFFGECSFSDVAQNGEQPMDALHEVGGGFLCEDEDTTSKQEVSFDRSPTRKVVLPVGGRGLSVSPRALQTKVPQDMTLQVRQSSFQPMGDVPHPEDDRSLHTDLLPHRKRTSLFFAVSLFVILSVALFLVLIFRGSEPEAELPPYGRVVISSSPAGADVVFDDSRLPARTPTEIDGVTPEVKHTLQLSLPGFPTWRKNFVLMDTRQPVVFHVNLKEKQPRQSDLTGSPIIANAEGQGTGRLTIESQPPGALIYLDGLSTGFSTPRTLHGVVAKLDHVVLLEGKSGGMAFARTTVEENQQRSLKLTLRKNKANLRGRIEVRVESEPEGAMVIINGFPLKKTPLLVSLLASKASEIELELKGYHTYLGTVRPVPGVDLTLYFRLQKKQ